MTYTLYLPNCLILSSVICLDLMFKALQFQAEDNIQRFFVCLEPPPLTAKSHKRMLQPGTRDSLLQIPTNSKRINHYYLPTHFAVTVHGTGHGTGLRSVLCSLSLRSAPRSALRLPRYRLQRADTINRYKQ